MKKRFLGNIAAGHLPTVKERDVLLYFKKNLDNSRRRAPPSMPGTAIFEALVDKWYKDGYRIIAIDPLAVLEASLGIIDYPGVSGGMNLHKQDMMAACYYHELGLKYDDLAIITSLHMGKSKKDHTDPNDMIAGTTGFGAGAGTLIAMTPAPDQLEAEPSLKGETPRRFVLNFLGRSTLKKEILIEQHPQIGLWQALGHVEDEVSTSLRRRCFETLLELGGNEKYVSADEIAKKIGRIKARNVMLALSRAHRQGQTHLGWRLFVKRGPSGGYRLVGRS